jgi:large subunit ribosomal protein L25
MNEIKLQAQTRTEMKKNLVSNLREQGIIPAVVYGGKENLNIKLKRTDFTKVYKQAGDSTIITLVVDGKKNIPVLVQDEQLHPVKDDYTHADFFEIDMNKEIVVSVALEFINEAPALKEMGGTLVKNLTKIDVKALPANLIHSIQVDLSVLKTFAESIHVKDLVVPATVQLLANPELLVAKVVEQKVEVEAPVVVATTEVAAEPAKAGEAKSGDAKATDAKAAPAKK